MMIVLLEYSISELGVPGVPDWPEEPPPTPPEAFAANTIPVIKPAKARSPRIPKSTGLHEVFYLSADGAGGGGIVLVWL